MKNDTPTITLLGNNSGRNLGDAAILSSIMEHLSTELKGVKFYVPSIAPNWITKHYAKKYNVTPIDVMPWTLSLRLLGLPTLRCFAKSDVALICDGIIFGKKLFNPAFNYLITLFFLVPFAKLFKCKLVCYNCGIGPFPCKLSKWMAKYLINNCDLVTMREDDSRQLAKEIGVNKEIHLTGDSAFINPVDSTEVGKGLLKQIGISTDTDEVVGVNVTKYLDTWLTKEEQLKSGSDLLTTIANGILEAKKHRDFKPVIFCTQPMDLATCQKLAELIQAPIIDNTNYLSHQIQAAMRECKAFIGMRFHSLILASAVAAPIIGLIYAPKVRGYMRLLKCPELGLELASLTNNDITTQLVNVLEHSAEIQKQQQDIIEGLRAGAKEAAKLLIETSFK